MNDPARFSLREGLELAGADLDEVWWRYTALGGCLEPTGLALCLVDSAHCDPREHDLIAQTLNEAFLDIGHDTFPVGYRRLPTSLPSRPAPTSAMRSLDARRQAALARLRGAVAARRSSELQATAAQLMRASGQLQFARRAELRARAALVRAAGIDAA